MRETFLKDQLLSQYSTFGIGGPARYFLKVQTVEQMQEVITYCNESHTPYIVIGKGSNCLFDSKGYCGLVIQNRIEFCHDKGNGEFYVGAGYNFSLLGTQTARKGYAGLEFASGIPGSVGGAVYMNAGANQKETCESLKSVEFIDASGELHNLLKEDIEFSYRTSSFQSRSGAIVSATFALNACPEARQKQIKIIHYRTATQPYSDKSAGCVFRNPDKLQDNTPSAAALIDKMGLKGLKVGGAEVSMKHGNFIVNKGDATAENVLELMELIKQKIKSTTGYELHAEIRLIPYDAKH
ncbi:MAG: UDP-N-acetylmuramate dehydrogenase [Parachlamydiales bacterium]|nr:UDP-N-acetylmuramate dehydrogenase [Parachlamydiales bacterium]